MHSDTPMHSDPHSCKYCSAFQSDVSILDGKAYQKFNKSLMFDLGVELQFSAVAQWLREAGFEFAKTPLLILNH